MRALLVILSALGAAFLVMSFVRGWQMKRRLSGLPVEAVDNNSVLGAFVGLVVLRLVRFGWRLTVRRQIQLMFQQKSRMVQSLGVDLSNELTDFHDRSLPEWACRPLVRIFTAARTGEARVLGVRFVIGLLVIQLVILSWRSAYLSKLWQATSQAVKWVLLKLVCGMVQSPLFQW